MPETLPFVSLEAVGAVLAATFFVIDALRQEAAAFAHAKAAEPPASARSAAR